MNPRAPWQDPVNAGLAVLILVSPWAAGYALVQPALANAVIVGALLFTVCVAAGVHARPWVECAVVALGVWLLVSPWVLEIDDAASRRVAVALGGCVLALSLGALVGELQRRLPGAGRSSG